MLQIKNIVKHYGKVPALNGLSLSINSGETVVVMGPSGCGKSTMIRCINRLTQPDAGEIILDGTSILALGEGKLRALRREIGFVFQQFNLISRLTVLENVIFHLVLAGIERKQAIERARYLLNRVGLSGHEDKLPSTLSGGEQQRVGIARALAFKPSLMLWDEPTASLDPILVGEVLTVMEELVENTDTTMIIVTHEIGFARKVADRIVLMDRGVVVEDGPPDRVFANPQSEVGRKYQQLILN